MNAHPIKSTLNKPRPVQEHQTHNHIPWTRKEMMFLKDCPKCQKTCKWTQRGAFVCTTCTHFFD